MQGCRAASALYLKLVYNPACYGVDQPDRKTGQEKNTFWVGADAADLL